MPRRITVLAVLTLCAVCELSAQVPQLVSHQGKLLDSSGQPVPDGPYSMTFRLYDQCVGGNLLLTDAHNVQARNGIYSVFLGGGALAAGTEADLMGVFANHSQVCLGTTVGIDSEMVPRQEIVSSGFALKAGAVDELSSLTARKANGTYYCGADWDANDTPGEADDVIACIQGALAELTTNEDGQDNSVSVKLPEGYFDVSSACSAGSCFQLKSGIHISGEMPRVKFTPSQAPDLLMEPNGGTWLDPGPSNTLFVGQNLRGIVLERFGVANFGKIAAFGGDMQDGISFSFIRDVYGIGTALVANPRSTTAWELYNIQHIRMDQVKVYNVERGLDIIAQSNEWQPANSVITDLYVYTYIQPEAGVRLEARPPSVGDSKSLNYVTFIRPQVNAFDEFPGNPGTSGIHLKGNGDAFVQGCTLIGVDVEGPLDAAVRLSKAVNNYVLFAGGTTDATAHVVLEADAVHNVVTSHSAGARIQDLSGGNVTTGLVKSASGARGVYREESDANQFKLRANAISVAASPLGDADKGNIRTEGIGHNTGHYETGNYHLWDSGFDGLRIKPDTPTSNLDGQPLLTGSGDPTYGPATWASTISCDAACNNRHLTCVTGFSLPGATSPGGNACQDSSGTRLCLCQ